MAVTMITSIVELDKVFETTLQGFPKKKRKPMQDLLSFSSNIGRKPEYLMTAFSELFLSIIHTGQHG